MSVCAGEHVKGREISRPAFIFSGFPIGNSILMGKPLMTATNKHQKKQSNPLILVMLNSRSGVASPHGGRERERKIGIDQTIGERHQTMLTDAKTQKHGIYHTCGPTDLLDNKRNSGNNCIFLRWVQEKISEISKIKSENSLLINNKIIQF